MLAGGSLPGELRLGIPEADILQIEFETYLCAPKKRSVRLGVRTPDFHSGNTGSIPVRTTLVYNQEPV